MTGQWIGVSVLAVFINVVAVLVGSAAGRLFGRKPSDGVKTLVMVSAGLVTLLVGLKMAWEDERILYLVLSVMIGGLIGSALDIEGRILRFGDTIQRLLPFKTDGQQFSQGFLTASVLFCVGAMAILGSFQAVTEGKMDIILVKSVMDGFMAFLLTGALGIGVGFSALSILLYQGALTLLAGWVNPWVQAHPLVLHELSGVGGLMVVMISLNLLELKKIPTGNFLPALVLAVLFVLADPWISPLITTR